ncbi:MAG: putative F420-0 ABC transporter substrate-binding protein [Microcella sp.]|uniref:putative F420-0 ABC transporter substrate-binding protein n=1 Tax=Microcella sp. TaxID=1913979 RepID=UPI00331485F2
MRTRTSPIVALIVAVTATGGCTVVSSGAAPAPSAPSSGASLTIDNCGTEVIVDAPPQRVVTVKSSSTELLLALGLGDRIVAQAFPDGPVPERWSDGVDIPTLSESAPGREAVLALEPDFVFAGWESVFSADSAGERESYAALGIDTYVAPSACKDPAYQPESMTVDLLEEHVREVAQIFDVDPVPFLEDQRATLDGIAPDSRGLTALWYSSGTETPYVGAGIGNPQLIMDLIGVENVAEDVRDTWTSMSWEAIVDANPDVIVLVDASWNSVEDKIALLEGNAATSRLEAVVNGRYLVIPFASTEAGARTAWAAEDLSAQLRMVSLP